MKDFIYSWIKNKQNYIYYCIKEEDGYKKFYTRLTNAFLQALITTEEHEATPFYIFLKYKNKDYEIHYETLKKGKNTGKSLNQEFYKTLQAIVDKVHLYNFEKELNEDERMFMFFKHLENSEQTPKKKYFYRYDPLEYKKIDTIPSTNFLLQTVSHLQINDYLYELIKNIKKYDEYKNLEEIGFFYPVQYKHNIFENKHYLFELNPYKFQNNTVSQNTEKYLIKNFNLDYFQNKQYFHQLYKNKVATHHSKCYDKSIAYFNPLLLLNVHYEKEISILTTWFEKNKIKEPIESFYYSLFDTLNELTYYGIYTQFENLLNTILMNKYNSKRISKKDFVELLLIQKKQVIYSKDKIHISEYKKIEVLDKIRKFYEKSKIEKNHKLNYQELKIDDAYDKVIFFEVQNAIDLFYNKQKSLQALYTNSLQLIKNLLKSYKMPQKLHKAFRKIILDLLTLNTQSNMKKSFNAYIEQKHKDISKQKLEKRYKFEFEL